MRHRSRRNLRAALWALCLVLAPLGRGNGQGLAVEQVHFDVPHVAPGAPALLGYLRRPEGHGPFPAVVLLHGCGGDADKLDDSWGARIQDWGYITLTVDSFGPRGIISACTGMPVNRLMDAYGALQFLGKSKLVDPNRVAVMGFSQGGINALWDVERGVVEQEFTHKFRAAIAFYPLCSESGAFTVPTLILNGQRDDWSFADACRRMVAQESDIGVARAKTPAAPVELVIIPGAFHGFDHPWFLPGHRYLGHWLEYDQAATEQAATAVRAFLQNRLAH